MGWQLFEPRQVILVTGASSGIGRAIALECNAQGATVLACGRNMERLAESRDCALHPERWISLQRDFAEDVQSLPRWISTLVASYGKLWGMAHAAGDGIMDCLQTYDLQASRRLLELNFQAPMLLAQGFCNRKNSIKGGALLFVTSASALYPEKGHLTYGAIKTALAAAAHSISQEVAPRLRVHCLAPGKVDTPLEARAEAFMGPEYREQQLQGYPFGFGKPEDIANMAAFLLSNKASWITGQNFVLSGGRY